MAGLRRDMQEDASAQAREYARAASGVGHFRNRPPARQDSTMRNHLASRFERRLDAMGDAARQMDADAPSRPIVGVSAGAEPVFMDMADLAVMDDGLRIVVEDIELFDRVRVTDLTPPPSDVTRNVLLDVLRRDGTTTVIATALGGAVYGLTAVQFDDQGSPAELVADASGREGPPLDDEACERIWTHIGIGARTHGRTLPKIRKPAKQPKGRIGGATFLAAGATRSTPCTDRDADELEPVSSAEVGEATAREPVHCATDQNTPPPQNGGENLDYGHAPSGPPWRTGALGGRLPISAGLKDLIKPIDEAPFDEEQYAAYAARMAGNPVTRVLLDVMATTIVASRRYGNAPEEDADVVTRMFLETYRVTAAAAIKKVRRRHGDLIETAEQSMLVAESEASTLQLYADKARTASRSLGAPYNAIIRLFALHAADPCGTIATDAVLDGGAEEGRIDGGPFHVGVVVIKNRTLFEIVSRANHGNAPYKTRREVPLLIAYRAGPDDVVGVVQQLDARHTNLICTFEVKTGDAMAGEETGPEADLTSAMRDVLGPVIARENARRAAIEALRIKEQEPELELGLPEVADAEKEPINVSAIADAPDMDMTDGQAGRATAMPGKDEGGRLKPEREFVKGMPSDRKMRALIRVSLNVEDHAAAAEAIDGWYDRTAESHARMLLLDRRNAADGWRIEHADAEDRQVWAVSVRRGQGTPPRVEITVETTAIRVSAALPALVMQIAQATNTRHLDGPVDIRALTCGTRPQMRALMADLIDPERRLPILVLTSDVNGEYIMEPQDAVRMTPGAMRVRVVTPSMTTMLRDAWSQDFTVFGGAARIYQPGFDPETSDPRAHQRFMPRPGARSTLDNAMRREIAATIDRYPAVDRLEEELEAVARDVAELAEVRAAATPMPASTSATAGVRTIPAEKPKPAAVEDPVVVEPTATTAEPEVNPVATTVPERSGQGEQDFTPVATGDRETPTAPRVPTAPTVDLTRPERVRRGKGERPASEQPEAARSNADTDHEPATRDALTQPQDEPADARAATEGLAVTGVPDADAVMERMVRRMVEAAMAAQMARVDAFEARLDAAEAERDTARAQLRAVQTRAVERSDQDRDDLARERSDNAELMRIAEQERDEAQDAATELRRMLAAANAQIAELQKEIDRLRTGGTVQERTPLPLPTSLDQIGDWANEEFQGRLVIHPRACRALSKSIYTDVDRTVGVVALLAGPYMDARRGVEGAHQRWLEGLDEMRIKDHKQNDAGGPEKIQFRIDHDGRQLRLDRHLKGRESSVRGRGAFRVYFTYDEIGDQVVIGYMPDHLTTNAT